MTSSEIGPVVRRVIAETFNYPESDITDDTVAEDVDGWDSLKHTILMIRLGRALGISIPEEVAANASSVGDLIDRLSAIG